MTRTDTIILTAVAIGGLLALAGAAWVLGGGWRRG
jgi:hypothetical protein